MASVLLGDLMVLRWREGDGTWRWLVKLRSEHECSVPHPRSLLYQPALHLIEAGFDIPASPPTDAELLGEAELLDAAGHSDELRQLYLQARGMREWIRRREGP